MNSSFPTMLPPKRAAQTAGISLNHINSLMREGKVYFVTIGCKRLINMRSLLAYLNGEVQTNDDC